ncbi:predicted protein [Naegleria gruberi]|uniref:Predicted protein n=1 Tax=Naegleria gruberi TaxID=5762 RepID=D2VCL9_NAEGR|nr:uncharacterized protein NAEGRDRAFT_48456 [Naegleria gruberi]EFC45442.1 predicted protein [Naegleria gruberi]|eukprot:XP_002678186.1 predicted protein [Naegleria gruberi strain NEG-M]
MLDEELAESVAELSLNQEEEEGNVNLTLEEIMCLSEEDLLEMGTTREELIEMMNVTLSDNNHDNDQCVVVHDENNDENNDEDDENVEYDEFASDEEIEIEIDDSALENLDVEEEVQVRVEDLPFLNEIYLENMMNWSWDEHLNPNLREFPIPSASNQTISISAGLSKKNRLKKEKKLKEDPSVSRKPVPISKVFHHPISFWANYNEIITNRFKSSYPVSDIKCIIKNDLLNRFTKAIISEEQRIGKSVTDRIFLCFHGTSPHNIESIIENGLLVPGKNNNLSVINGSALGVGIYVTVMDPRISVGYCGGGNQLFACAVLLSDTVNTKNHGNVLVIKEEKFILPCFLVTVKTPMYMNQYNISSQSEKQANEEEKKNLTKKGEVVFSKKKKEEEREKIRKKKIEKKIKQTY